VIRVRPADGAGELSLDQDSSNDVPGGPRRQRDQQDFDRHRDAHAQELEAD
jgi:hypothetical protein